jgi:hypothetical protein
MKNYLLFLSSSIGAIYVGYKYYEYLKNNKTDNNDVPGIEIVSCSKDEDETSKNEDEDETSKNEDTASLNIDTQESNN